MDEVVQRQATLEDIIHDHIMGLGGYAIAEKYGMDTDKVKQIIHEADVAGKFVPAGAERPVDDVNSPDVAPIEEGVNPPAELKKTK